MPGFIDDIQNQIEDYYWGADTGSLDAPPGTWYIALFTVMPNDDGTGGTEAAFGGYARQAVANDLTEWPAAVSGTKSNANPVDYGVASTGPTSVVGFGFYDDPTAGDLWATADLTGAPVSIPDGGDASFATGAIVIDRC